MGLVRSGLVCGVLREGLMGGITGGSIGGAGWGT